MMQIRKSADRGWFDHGWLQSFHSFSFAEYFDQRFMGFGNLRVINEDKIQGGKGFATHGHRDMEIVTYVIDGALEHKDSMGNTAVMLPGEVQRMSAGTGVMHSEYNHLSDKTTHLLQIWILPQNKGTMPSYQQKDFKSQLSANGLVLVASLEGKNGSVSIGQDVNLYALKSSIAKEEVLYVGQERLIWLQVVAGEVRIDNQLLTSGDGAAISKVAAITLRWNAAAEFLLFDMAP